MRIGGIENNLHWHTDVRFNEDCTHKKKNAAANISLLSKIALMMVKNSSKKESQGSTIYELSGLKVTDVENLKGGVYIMNGRKVVIT